ncbi:MAG: hypothetical protein RMN51_09755 [Verrucomicrobiota bacterium]|nr:hypothetical protein [Limisphaera sp.]MDW8382375.1 hypothetical protein [Verrucomicrobiota bacterium]
MPSSPEEPDRLRRLLVLKRYERPPAGCLDEVRRAVLEELRRSKSRSVHALEGFRQSGWWLAWREALAPRPLWAGALGVGICALVIGAVLQAERLHLPMGLEGSGGAAHVSSPAHGSWMPVHAPVGPGLVNSGVLLAVTNLHATPGQSLGPVVPSSLFQPPLLEVQRASGAPPALGPLLQE